MSLSAVKILEINITKSSKKEILEHIQKYLKSDRKIAPDDPHFSGNSMVIVTPNPEQIVYASRHPHFAELLNRADVALPDGSGLLWANRLLHGSGQKKEDSGVTETIPGVDFMQNLVAAFSKQGVPMALIGGKENIAVKAFECLRQKYPQLRGVALEAPSFIVGPSGRSDTDSELRIPDSGGKSGRIASGTAFFAETSALVLEYSDAEDYVRKLAGVIRSRGIGLVFVGLGAPKQEYCIDMLKSALSGRPPDRKDEARVVFMAVGGSFDFLAGTARRAPASFSEKKLPFSGGTIGSEWLWRLFREPWRVGRQLSLITFVWMVFRKRYTLK